MQKNLPVVELQTGTGLAAGLGFDFICSQCFHINTNHFSVYSNFEFTSGIQYHSN